MKHGRKRNPQFWKRLEGPLLLLGAILSCLLFFEIVARIAVSGTPSSVVLEYRVNFSGGMGSIHEIRQGELPFYHGSWETNYELVNDPGAFRVIFLGDSMTKSIREGEVEERDLFTALLEESLQGYSDDVNYELLNFGVAGYNLRQIESVFEEALRFKPDLIIYNYFVNDVNIPSLVNGREGHYEIWSYEQSIPYLVEFPGNGKLLLHSHAYRFFNRKMCVMLQKFSADFVPRSFNTGWETAKQSLQRMIARAGDEEVPFVIMLSPHFEHKGITGSYRPNQFIIRACQSGVQIWDVSEDLAEKYDSKQLRFSDEDWHPNRLGNMAIADVLHDYFEEHVVNRSTLKHLIPTADADEPCTIV